MTQQNDGDAKAMTERIEWDGNEVLVRSYTGAIRSATAADLEFAGYVHVSAIPGAEAVRRELGKWIQLVNRIHQAAHTTAGNDGLPARVEELFQATEERLEQAEANLAVAAEECDLLVGKERARAEEAERQLANSEEEVALYLNKEGPRLRSELAAANARVGRLEEALQRIRDYADSLHAGDMVGIAETALSAAPQASTPRDNIGAGGGDETGDDKPGAWPLDSEGRPYPPPQAPTERVEREAAAAYVYQELGDDASEVADDIRAGLHIQTLADDTTPQPDKTRPNNGYCAYGACVNAATKNGLCGEHWSAPQVSTEQGERCGADRYPGLGRLCTKPRGHDGEHWEGSDEEPPWPAAGHWGNEPTPPEKPITTSPIPQVAQASGEASPSPAAGEPAQPATGGAELRVDGVVRVTGIRLRNGSLGTVKGYNSANDGLWSVQMHEDLQTVRYPASELEPTDAACPRCHSRNKSERRILTDRSVRASFACINDWHDPTSSPALPVARGVCPAVDAFRAELVEALRWYHNHGSTTHSLADRLEGK